MLWSKFSVFFCQALEFAVIGRTKHSRIVSIKIQISLTGTIASVPLEVPVVLILLVLGIVN